MSDELNDLKKEVSESVSKFASTPRIKQAWDEASTPAKIAGCALAVGLLWKPALLVAFGTAAYAGVKAFNSYTSSGPKPPEL